MTVIETGRGQDGRNAVPFGVDLRLSIGDDASCELELLRRAPCMPRRELLRASGWRDGAGLVLACKGAARAIWVNLEAFW